jgi:diguanylate cyclase (GGDEF)-like protein
VKLRGATRARDPQAAAHSARLILLVCAGVIAGLTLLGQQGSGTLALAASWIGVAVMLGIALVCSIVSADRLDRLRLHAVIAITGVVLTAALNLATSDSSAAAQAFYAFPVFWAASHLRPVGVTLVTATAVIGDLTGLFLLLPVADALTDGLMFGSVIVVMAMMLTRANTRQERLVVALETQARVDALTGLVNRRAFDDALGTTLHLPDAAGTALLLIDVDAFKTVNDQHGHPVGDALLVHLAGVLRDQIRAEDAVLSRLGGDELAVLLPDCPPDVANRRAQQLLTAVHATPLELPDGTLLALSISVGVAHVTEATDDLEALYHAADAALYDAKRAGRGRVAVAVG